METNPNKWLLINLVISDIRLWILTFLISFEIDHTVMITLLNYWLQMYFEIELCKRGHVDVLVQERM